MKVFCVRCGTAVEIEPSQASAFLTCAQCGATFSARPPAAPQKSSSAPIFILIAVIAVPVVVAVIGILAAIAIPNFIRFQSRAKQSECKTNLKSLYTAQKAYALDHEGYTSKLSELSFRVEPRNRYAYYAGAGPLAKAGTAPGEAEGVEVDVAAYPRSNPAGGPLPALLAGGARLGVEGQCPDCDFTAACVSTLVAGGGGKADVWSVSTRERVGPDGETIAPGQPFNDVNAMH